MTLRGFSHVAVVVADADRSIRFYVDLLGCSVTADTTYTGRTIGTLLGLGECTARSVALAVPGSDVVLELLQLVDPPSTGAAAGLDRAGTGNVGFLVDDLRAEHARLAAAGVRFRSEPVEIDGALAVHFLDPDGFALELVQLD